MKFNFRTLTTRGIFRLLLGLFVLLFLARFVYSFYQKTYDPDLMALANPVSSGSFFENQTDLRKNYASEKQAPPPPSQGGLPAEASQKYEKTASLNARSENFETEEKRLRGLSTDFNAIIQYEQRIGNPGNRAMHLMIGVRPELFDSFYVAAQRIGRIYFNSVVKVDKTTEFRELNAKRASLEKALANLTDLKNRAGSISDLVGLHDKILDIERQMQELGVQLGNFSAENEFCTVRFSLYENEAARAVPWAERLFDAFVWTIQYYLLLMLGLAGALLVALLAVVVIKNVLETRKPEQR